MFLPKMINMIFQFLNLMITLRIILSFFPNLANPSIVKVIYQVTEPILAPFRTILHMIIPMRSGFYLDFSPLLAIFVLDLFKNLIIKILFRSIF